MKAKPLPTNTKKRKASQVASRARALLPTLTPPPLSLLYLQQISRAKKKNKKECLKQSKTKQEQTKKTAKAKPNLIFRSIIKANTRESQRKNAPNREKVHRVNSIASCRIDPSIQGAETKNLASPPSSGQDNKTKPTRVQTTNKQTNEKPDQTGGHRAKTNSKWSTDGRECGNEYARINAAIQLTIHSPTRIEPTRPVT